MGLDADICTDDDLLALASTDEILKYFRFGHLPEKLQEISMFFAALALEVVRQVPRSPERTACFRKLLEAKDCAVRAAL